MNELYDEYCNECERKLNPSKIVWLELDQRSNTYTSQGVPLEYSQGCFAFGKDCAKKMERKHEEATK